MSSASAGASLSPVEYRDFVYRVALRLLRHSEDAEDATQEVLVRIVRFLPGFAYRSAITTWLYRVTFNVCMNHLRGRERDDACRQRLAHLTGAAAWDRLHERLAVRDAVQRLPARYGQPLALFFFREMSYVQIARELGLPVKHGEDPDPPGEEPAAVELAGPRGAAPGKGCVTAREAGVRELTPGAPAVAPSPGVDFELTTSIGRLREAGWDRLAGAGDLYCSTLWLLMTQETKRSDTYHLLGWQLGRLVSGLTCHLLPPAPAAPLSRVDLALARHLWPQGPGPEHRLGRKALAGLLPNLSCGGRQVGYTSVLSAATDRRRRRGLLDETVAAAEVLAASTGARSISFGYVSEDDHDLRQVLRERGFLEFFQLQRGLLELDEPGFDGYLRRFRCHRRTSIRHELYQLEAGGIELAVRPLGDAPLDRLAELERNLLRRYRVRRTPRQIERTLRQLTRWFPGSASVVTASRRGQLCGFAAMLRWRDRLHVRHCGADYDLQDGLPVYFGVIFYEPVRFALATGAITVEYGPGSIPTKVARGCRAIGQYGYVKCLQPAVHREIAELLRTHETPRGESGSNSEESAQTRPGIPTGGTNAHTRRGTEARAGHAR